MRSLTSRLSAKGQTTIPKPVRDSLGIAEGDAISFEVREDEVVLRKVPALDFEWAGAVEPTLSEWEDDLDDEL
ncbi:MAG: AbrB/MazE/SpoVT family DNA-binding domain-containing protein [Spirochaetaceae bacterium]|nr:MAG: AbrB/MazE/SpoVT family DNA-binding domain-containing protein [Spirochaetaceae bacterium]